MALGPIIDVLRAVPLFAKFPEEPLRVVAFGAEKITRRRGQRLFTVGAPAFTGLVVVDGAVEMRAGADRLAPPLAIVGPGALIGELALLLETTRPATAVMAEDGTLIEIPRLLMRRVLDEFPEVAVTLKDMFAERLAETMTGLTRVRETMDALGPPSQES